MLRPPIRFVPLAALLVLAAAAAPQARGVSSRPLFFAELSAGPLVGIERPLKGCAGDILFGCSYAPFEAGLRAGAAYDAALGYATLRLDFEIGLGGGLRAIIGGLVSLGRPSLCDPTGVAGSRVPVEPAAWPDRFGFAATIAELPWRLFGAQLGIDAEIAYTAYALGAGGWAAPASAKQLALSGAAAFAAAVEARIAVRLRWPCASQ